jgi:hypothetical protein
MRWPGKIPKGKVCSELATTMDLLPTLAKRLGVALPANRVIDGKDIWPLMSGRPGAKSPHAAFYYYWAEELQAVRSWKWKLHLPHKYQKLTRAGAEGKPGQYTATPIGLALFDLDQDIGETNNVADKFPEVVQRLQVLAEKAREDLGDSGTGRKGKNVREPGRGPIQPSADGGVLLHARDATIHGTTVRYEPQTNKNTIGFWTRLEDWVSWDFEIHEPGTYSVVALQGCGPGSGGSEVEFAVGSQALTMKVQETGGFQDFVSRDLGRFRFAQPGSYRLAVRPKTKPGHAVMDLRSVTLRPAPGRS